jgi:hypothetical protein
MDIWRPIMDNLKKAIAAVVEGNISSFSIILAATHSELIEAASKLPQLTVSRDALVRVLNEWLSGRWVADNVQQWASFVRRGYVPGSTTDSGLNPIDIEYDKDDEELIVEIIGRFDEIGDDIDGEVSSMEQKDMLRILRGIPGTEFRGRNTN